MGWYSYVDTPIGRLRMVEDAGVITELGLCDTDLPLYPEYHEKETALILQTKQELAEYFAGTRRSFTVPLRPKGTAFQLRVWDALLNIPYGETRSYGEIAKAIGCPRGARAVGMANNRNPIIIMIPCHRVIGANGKLVGYAGGLHSKEALLRLEGVLP